MVKNRMIRYKINPDVARMNYDYGPYDPKPDFKIKRRATAIHFGWFSPG